jgi:hydroxymethylpyrimidine/phosphomethylpyrimidine kinase
MSVVTALTAQNTMGVTDISECTPDFVARQLDAVFTDIIPDAVKIGMVSNPQIIQVIGERLKHYKAANIVIDPVMVSNSGSRLLTKTQNTPCKANFSRLRAS